MKKQLRKKWHIILLDNIASGNIKQIAFKLPSDVKYCTGVLFSGSVAGNSAKNKVIGNLSYFVNNRRRHVVHYIVQSKSPAELKRKHETLPLNEAIIGGSLIQGFYEDLASAVSYPYKLRIYLKCWVNG